MPPPNIVLGLPFYAGRAQDAVVGARGLCVFPSAPGLAAMDRDLRYRQGLVAADTCFVDSGFLALAWFCLSGERLVRVSGLRFIKAFLDDPFSRGKRILWIHPTPPAQKRNSLFLEFEKKFPPALSTHALAPIYPAAGRLSAPALLALIREKQPHVIVINLGGGIQEPLGAYLKANLPYSPIILCTGGAIDFLTGAQARIPDWADRLLLGWLFRVFTTPPAQAKSMRVSPTKRYWGAWRLLLLLIKFRRNLPQ